MFTWPGPPTITLRATDDDARRADDDTRCTNDDARCTNDDSRCTNDDTRRADDDLAVMPVSVNLDLARPRLDREQVHARRGRSDDDDRARLPADEARVRVTVRRSRRP